jgi:hypothetical protein
VDAARTATSEPRLLEFVLREASRGDRGLLRYALVVTAGVLGGALLGAGLQVFWGLSCVDLDGGRGTCGEVSINPIVVALCAFFGGAVADFIANRRPHRDGDD